MHLTTLSLFLGSCLAAPPAAPPGNLGFTTGTLAGWEGEGFTALAPADNDPRRLGAVSSREAPSGGRQGSLHYTLTVPAGASVLCCTAYAARGQDCPADDRLDVQVHVGRQLVPKLVRTAKGWRAVPALLPPEDGQPRDYLWPLAPHAGQNLRIQLVDRDDRPGCYVHCSGFQILTHEEFEGREFSRFMVGLAREHQLFPMMRFDSRHFTALSNAADAFSEGRLRDCETLYRLFYDHFRRKGFGPRLPAGKLMVAIFDSQAGFEAYLGRKMSPLVTGIYHPASNRLVIYDYGQNRAFQAAKRQAERNGQVIPLQMDRLHFLDGIERQAKDFRTDTNIATIMHEAAHQLSFNCGLLNREGDVPAWLAEGLACYCEATAGGAWQGLGEPNPERLAALADVSRRQGQLLGLRELVEGEDWLRGKGEARTILLGYAQSWALFRLLMEEHPQALAAYLKLIYSRQTRERRLADFEQAFGTNLVRLEKRYREYVRELVGQQAPPKR